ncbi:ABC transporter permease [Cnuibacter physcomitrellae]|uniref:ABC transporter permease n=1 Tax=Cnuibacter physcomitrellae TaxID=1619308 RepID=UPI002175A82D|nr:ABC transporter permease [Cnuibacter physcomitrellae]MCS5497838.1 ABC transporter permease [Cnuibacter physcomitrellae]
MKSLARPLNWGGGILLPIAAIVILCIVFSLLAPSFFQFSTLIGVLRESSVLLVVAIGMTFVVLMGSIDLSVGATVTLSGLVAATIAQSGNWVLAILGGLAVGIVVGVVNGVLFAFVKVPSFLTTLGISLAVTGVGLWFVNGRPVQVFEPGFTWISQGKLFGELPMIAIWAIILWVVFSFIGQKTRFGRYTFAIGGAEAVSGLAGIPIRRMKLWVMVLSGGLAAAAGILLASRVGAATPGMGDRLTLDSIAAVVMGGTALTGGVGGVHRTILGVLVITVLTVGLNTLGVQPYLQQIVQGAVVVLAVALTLDRSKLLVIK